ncbi:MAG: thermonuclease family protein [Solirubrobacterales bacterium]
MRPKRNGIFGSARLPIVVALLGTVRRPEEAEERRERVVRADRRRHDRSLLEDGGRDDVRLIGVETPKTVKPDTRAVLRPRASSFTHHLLDGRGLSLTFGVERRDVNGRPLAKLSLGHRFVSAILVRRGLAPSLMTQPRTASQRCQASGAACGPRRLRPVGRLLAMKFRDFSHFGLLQVSVRLCYGRPRPTGHDL